MKLKKNIVKTAFFASLFCALYSCATYQQQIGKDFSPEMIVDKDNSALEHQLILLGNVSEAYESSNYEPLLKTVERYIQNSTTNNTLLFLGNNALATGMPDSLDSNRKLAEDNLNAQINIAKAVNGKTIFLPGTHDWNNRLTGLIDQKKYVEDKLGDNAFMPAQYDAIHEVEIADNLTLLTIDSEWFIQNWDKHAQINENSFIKTREDFFEEFSRLINKNQNKVTVVALHHPLITNGQHGGYFSAKDHLFPYKKIPLPVVGTIANFIRKTSGANPADTQYSYYRTLIDRLITLTKNKQQVVFVSAHENNLQYIESEGIKQLISGSASKTKEARSVQHTSYTLGKQGFATLKVYANSKVNVALHERTANGSKIMFEKTIMLPDNDNASFPKVTQTSITTSVYPENSIQKSNTYTFLFGKHYRATYGTKVTAPVADLTVLNGGLKPVISYADNKSLSLVLENDEGKQYLLRRLRKSSKQFLQSAIFKDTYLEDKLDDTYVVDFIDDYYTTMHPYAPLVLSSLAGSANLYHANPKLYFVPKQNALGKYNETYGNELYMIEERPESSQKDLSSFGKGDKIISTQELLINLEKDKKFQIDTEMYLRARLFDFLIGDWDRNANQWLWVEKDLGNTIMYQPISRDHDQAFAKIDGLALILANRLNPLKHIQSYRSKYPNPRWITKSAFPLDKYFLQSTTATDWEKAAQDIVALLNDEAITTAFNQLPAQVQQKDARDIIRLIKERRSKLVAFSKKYHNELFKFGTVVGTNQKDQFTITTFKDRIEVEKINHQEKGDSLKTNYTFTPQISKEVWVYGLDEDDVIKVRGDKSKINLKIIGGRNNDHYDIATKNSIKIFDYNSQPNTFVNKGNARIVLQDQYALNQYDYRKAPLNIFSLFPDVGYNRDNGLMLGLNGVYTVNRFNQNPYSQRHQLRVKYSFATSGVYAAYNGSYKDYSNTGFWVVDALATSSNFTHNFFGKTNFESYDRDKFKENYYRVRTSQFEFKPGYEWKGRNGSSFLIGLTYESTKIEHTHNRLIDEQLLTELNDTYQRTNYLGSRIHYKFTNYDNLQEPTTGLGFSLLFGNRFFTDKLSQNHHYLNSKLNFVVPLSENKKLTWSSTNAVEMIFGSKYHFYQAPSIGANNGLRGYRQQRFIGHSSFVTSNDLRYKMNEIYNGILPLSYGIYLGFDTGKVWNKFTPTTNWYQSYGAGLWLNALDSFTMHAGAFSSKEEKVLISFGVGFAF